MKKRIARSARKVRNALRASFFALLAALLPFTALAQSTGFTNPAKAPDIGTFIKEFLVAVVQISLPILTLFIVYAGFMFVTARGNETKLTKAKENFKWVILGAILILGAWVLASLIASTASQVLGPSAT